MSYTLADLAAVREAIKTGAVEVVIGDRKIRYRSQDELFRLERIIIDALDESVDKPTQTSLVQATYTKGRK